MKKLTALLSVVLLVVLCAFAVSAAEDYIVWDFTDEATVALWKPSSTTNVTVTENGAVISGEGNDINLTFTPDFDLVLDNYSYFVFEYTDCDTAGQFQFYHWTDANSGNPYLTTTTNTCLATKTAQLKLTPASIATANWTGKVTRLRLDPFRGDEPRTITVKSVGLFKDADTYKSYTKQATEATRVEGDPVLLLNPTITNFCLPLSGNSCSIEYADTYAIMTSYDGPEEGGKGDPYFLVNTDFDGDSFPWMKVRIRNLSDATAFEMHFASEGSGGSVTASTCTHFDISSKDEDFVEYIINVKDANLASQNINEDVSLTASTWSGNIKQIRFDCMWMAEPSGQMPTGSQMYIDYIAFFATEADAKAFTPSAESAVEQPAKNTGAANPVWIFDNAEIVEQQTASGSSVSFSGGMLRMVPTSSDPTLTLRMDEEFDTEEFPIFAYRHSTKSKVSTLGIFFSTDNGATYYNAYSPVTITTNGSWSNAIVDMREYDHNMWSGNLVSLRIDPINGNDLEANIYIDRMGFFRTKTEAYAFLNEGRDSIDYSSSNTFFASYQKAIIPSNTLSEGYNESDYLLSSTTPAGSGTDPVVIRTNADGSTEIVAMSYTNSYGYTTFVANKAANYTLGYNDKQYSDIAGHWGEEYIQFVSNRTLFGGTSPTEFSPEDTMTRGMFITVLGRMHGVDTAKYDGNTGYGDVPATEYYAPYIQWAKEYNLMAGLSDVTFGAEDPIDRATMALVIAKYCDTFDFSMKGYEDKTDFTDLANCDAATVEAIYAMQKLGILNGKGDGIFDPAGLSTRAEVAAVMQRVIKCALGVNMANTQYDAAYFDRDRIRIGVWGFTSRFATEQGMQWLRDLGADLIVSGGAVSGSSGNTVFNYADKYGIEVFAQDFVNDLDTLKANTASYAEHPSFNGHYITDEPGTDSYPDLAEKAKMYNSLYPDKTPFVNLLPMYANAAQLKLGASAAAIEYYDADPDLYRKYCESWFEYYDYDYICTDIYPLNGTDGKIATWTTYNNYCESINQIATVAREHGKDFWCCIQTFSWASGKRNPTEAEYRWQSYAMLSYGCTGILLWSLTSTDKDYQSILNIYTGEPTWEQYENCATVMWELRELSDTYIQYKNLGAFTMNCTAATPWLKMSGEYKDFHILADTKSSEPLLIGCFEKKEGTGYAFTVVNMTDIKNQQSATFKFKLAQDLTVTLYDEAKPTVLTAGSDGYYTINLETTDGVFVTIG